MWERIGVSLAIWAIISFAASIAYGRMIRARNAAWDREYERLATLRSNGAER